MTKKSEQIKSIKGTRDILPPESSLWLKVEEICRGVFDVYGFQEIRTPIFEDTDLFMRSVGAHTDIVSKEMYSFKDRDGRSLTLRPEATASVMRAHLNSGASGREVKKYYYAGPMFRRERPQKGRFRQFSQIGAEVLGSASPSVDVEVLEMLDLLIRRSGLTGCELLLNSVGCSACRPSYTEALKNNLSSVVSKMCEDCQRRASDNPLRVLDCKVSADQPIIESMPKIQDYLCEECSEHFQDVISELDRRGQIFKLTPRLVRGLDYYTRTTFEVTHGSLGSQNTLLGGGRYDGLSELMGGPPIKGLGFAIGEDRFLMAVEKSQILESSLAPEVFIAWLGEEARKIAHGAARALRVEGLYAEISFNSINLKKSLSAANKIGARWTLIFGENEVRRGVFQIKNMKTGCQEELLLGELVQALKTRQGKSDLT